MGSLPGATLPDTCFSWAQRAVDRVSLASWNVLPLSLPVKALFAPRSQVVALLYLPQGPLSQVNLSLLLSHLNWTYQLRIPHGP